MLDIFLPILCLSALLYALQRAPRLLAPRRHSHRLSQPGETGWTFEYASKTFSVFTTAFNAVPQAIVSSSPASLSRVYDVGSIAGVGGSAVAVGGGLWALKEVWMAVWAEARIHAMQKVDLGVATNGMTKRAMGFLAIAPPIEVPVSGGGLQPLVRVGGGRGAHRRYLE
jgi:hypothetical protein